MLAIWVYLLIGSVLGSVIDEVNNREYGNENDLPKIIGGEEANQGDFPWQISIRARMLDWKHICGGSVIGNQWVVSAAHCFHKDKNEANFFVVAGDHDISFRDGNEQAFNVELISTHPGNHPKTVENDIALMKIAGSFKFNRFVNRIYVATPQLDAELEGNSQLHCVASGWGAIQFDGQTPTLPNLLQQVTMPLLPLKICRDSYARDPKMPKVTGAMICSGYGDGGLGTCKGDSGGPLACYVNNRWTLVGVTSWSKPCTVPGFPDLFARVSYFYNWMAKEIAQYP